MRRSSCNCCCCHARARETSRPSFRRLQQTLKPVIKRKKENISTLKAQLSEPIKLKARFGSCRNGIVKVKTLGVKHCRPSTSTHVISTCRYCACVRAFESFLVFLLAKRSGRSLCTAHYTGEQEKVVGLSVCLSAFIYTRSC